MISPMLECPRAWYRWYRAAGHRVEVKIHPARGGLAETVAAVRSYISWENTPEARALAGHPPGGVWEEAARALKKAVQKNRPVVVVGDYDVDGNVFTGTAVKALLAAGADPSRISWFVPSREDGYGFRAKTVKKFGLERLPEGSVVLVGDMGINDDGWQILPPGVLTICVDHHPALGATPPVDILIHDTSRCAGGLALKLAAALVPEVVEQLLPWAALATVADVVPLQGENHAIAKKGLELLNRGAVPEGMRVLYDAAPNGWNGNGGAAFTWYTLAFGLAPAINAAHRMGSGLVPPDSGVRLIVQPQEELARRLHEVNEERKRQTDVYAELARKNYAMTTSGNLAYAVLPDCPEGIIGLVASRLIESQGEITTAVFTDAGDCYKGSFRGRGIDLGKVAAEVAAMRIPGVRFGGHRDAAGATVPKDKFGVFIKSVSEAGKKHPVPVIREYFELPGGIEASSASELSGLQPWGPGNEEPLFAVPAAKLDRYRWYDDARRVARAGAHDWAAVRVKTAKASGEPYLTVEEVLCAADVAAAMKRAGVTLHNWKQWTDLKAAAAAQERAAQKMLAAGDAGELPEPSPGAHCGGCASAAECAVETACAGASASGSDCEQTGDCKPDPVALARKILLLEAALEQAKAELRAYVEKEGPVFAEGEWFGLYPSRTKVYDLDRLEDILAAAGGSLKDVVAVNPSRLKKAVAKLGVDPKAAVLEVKESVSFRHGKKPPEASQE